jgi:membrane protease YdiL (CAAX protease family)
LGVGLYPVGIALAIVIYWAILAVFAINYTFALPEIATITVFRALLCTILVPLVDEVIFRGWLFGRLRAVGLRDELVIAITSVVWAMLSAFALLAFIQVTINVLLGCMLGYARSRTNSIVAPIFLHSSFNIVTTLLIDIKL